MNEVTHIRKFNWYKWIFAVSRWFSIIAILYFVVEIGTQNGVFDDVLMKTIALFGFTLYIAGTGINLINRSSEDYWTYINLRR